MLEYEIFFINGKAVRHFGSTIDFKNNLVHIEDQQGNALISDVLGLDSHSVFHFQDSKNINKYYMLLEATTERDSYGMELSHENFNILVAKYPQLLKSLATTDKGGCFTLG